MALADPLNRLCSPSGGLYDMSPPSKFATLLRHLPEHVKAAKLVRVHANKDTAAASRIVQKWRTPTNPISQTQITSQTKSDFIIATPYADRGTLKISQLLKENRPFACLHPTSLINEIPKDNDGTFDKEITTKLADTTKIVLSDHDLTWIVNLPDDNGVKETMVYFVRPAPTHQELLAKTTSSDPNELTNDTRIWKPAIGCPRDEAISTIRHSVLTFRKEILAHDETCIQRHEVLIGLRSGTSTDATSPLIGSPPAPSPANPSVSFDVPQDSSAISSARELRRNKRNERAAQSQHEGSSTQ